MIISLKPHIIIRRPYKSVAGNGLVADGGRRQTERKKNAAWRKNRSTDRFLPAEKSVSLQSDFKQHRLH